MDKRPKLTPERAMRIGMAYRQMYALAKMMELEYSQHMDVNFRDPITHGFIKSIATNIKLVLQKHKALINDDAEISILEGMFHLNEINRMFLTMPAERIEAFADGMRVEIAKEEAAKQEGEEAA